MKKVENPVSTYWGHASLVEADLLCLKLLLERSKSWTHIFNLPGSMLPAFNIEKIEEVVETEIKSWSHVESHRFPVHERWKIKKEHKLAHA